MSQHHKNPYRTEFVVEDRKSLRRIIDEASEPDDDYSMLSAMRPRQRKDCETAPRPCPFVSCKFNTYLKIRSDGAVIHPEYDVMDMKVSNCAIDYNDANLDEIAYATNMTYQGAQQTLERAILKLSKTNIVKHSERQ